MDSSTSVSIIYDSFVRTNKFNTRNTSANKWSTTTVFSTLCKAEVKIKLPELNVTVHSFAPFHVSSQKSNYDLLRELGINLDFQNNFLDGILTCPLHRLMIPLPGQLK